VERVEGGCKWGGEEEGGGGCKWGGEEEGGAAATIGRGRWGRLGLGRRGGRALIHWIEINGPNSLSHLSSRPQRKKYQKIYCFPEECLLKLQTPMPQNMKEKRNGNLTSFRKIGVSQVGRPIFARHVVVPTVGWAHRTVQCAPESVRCANRFQGPTIGCSPYGKKSSTRHEQ
jgi:hypothetical protein